jgi:FixJ family two-component response regulator
MACIGGDTVFLVGHGSTAHDGLTRTLSEMGHTVLAFDSVMAFLANVRAGDGVACAVLDAEMPGFDGGELLGRMRAEGSEIPAIFLTDRADIATCVRAMRAGAIDFLVKPARAADLLDAIQRAHARSAQLCRERTTAVLLHERVNRLTIREREVLALVLRGMLNKQISFALSCCEATVKVHRSRLMRKLEMRSLAELLMCTQQLDAQLHATRPPALPSRRETYAIGTLAEPRPMRAAARPLS